MARFDRHMKPIRLLNENRRLRLIRDELKKDLQTERRKLKAKRNEQENSRARIKIISTSTIRATSETLLNKGLAGARKIGPGADRDRQFSCHSKRTRAAPKCET